MDIRRAYEHIFHYIVAVTKTRKSIVFECRDGSLAQGLFVID
jgi:hypothetical protein